MAFDVPSRAPPGPQVPTTYPTSAASLPPANDGMPAISLGPEVWLVLWFAIAAALAIAGGYGPRGRPPRGAH
jgi:hypothetical protein